VGAALAARRQYHMIELHSGIYDPVAIWTGVIADGAKRVAGARAAELAHNQGADRLPLLDMEPRGAAEVGGCHAAGAESLPIRRPRARRIATGCGCIRLRQDCTGNCVALEISEKLQTIQCYNRSREKQFPVHSPRAFRFEAVFPPRLAIAANRPTGS
jgi:hypothetical protein